LSPPAVIARAAGPQQSIRRVGLLRRLDWGSYGLLRRFTPRNDDFEGIGELRRIGWARRVHVNVPSPAWRERVSFSPALRVARLTVSCRTSLSDPRFWTPSPPAPLPQAGEGSDVIPLPWRGARRAGWLESSPTRRGVSCFSSSTPSACGGHPSKGGELGRPSPEEGNFEHPLPRPLSRTRVWGAWEFPSSGGGPKGGVVGVFTHEAWRFVLLMRTTPSACGGHPSKGGEF
jgi:hypothetical protein